MLGPALLGGVLVTLTAVQYDFMLGIGWRPVRDPGGAWPSGLALGPHGWAMDAAFAVSGALLAVFAVGLRHAIGGGSGAALLFLSGVAVSLLAFETDPIRRTGPRSWHGWIHDSAFVVFVVALIAALVLLGLRMRSDPRWRAYSRYTLLSALVTTASLLAGGPAYYLFVVTALVWFVATGVRLRRLSG